MRTRTIQLAALVLSVAGVVFLLVQAGGDGDSTSIERGLPAAAPEPAAAVRPAPQVEVIEPSPEDRLLSGQVVSQSGMGVGAAEIAAGSQRGESRWTRADARGRFEIWLPRSGSWRLAVSAEGYRIHEQALDVPDEGLETVLTLEAAGILTGRVRSGRGDPARYRVRLESSDGENAQVSCDTAGEYRFASLDPGEYRVHLDARSRSWSDVGKVVIRAGESTRLDIASPESGAVEVRARLPREREGQPERLRVNLLDVDSHIESKLSIVLAADGSGRIEDLSPGSYALQLTADPFLPSHMAFVEVLEGRDVEVSVSWPEARISGRVIDAQGRALKTTVHAQPLRAGARTLVPDSAITYRTQSEPDGSYSLSGMPPGEYLVSTRGSGYASARVRLEVTTSARLDLRVEPSQTLDVRVASQGTPVPGAVVFALRGPYSDWATQAETDDRGIARLSGLISGTYRVIARVSTAEGLETASSQVELRGGRSSTLTLDLNR